MRCPTCQRPFNNEKPPRTCYDCGKPIGRGHKYTFQNREGISTIVHRVCCNPKSYFRAAQNRKLKVVYYKDMTDEQIARATEEENELERQFEEWRKEHGRISRSTDEILP